MTGAFDQAIVSYVDAIEEVRGQDLSFRPDAKSPLPPEADENLPHFLLLSASIDAGVDSWHIRLLLADLSARLREQGREDGLFGLNEMDAEFIDAAIRRHQRQRRLGGYQARRVVPRILGDVNAFVAGPAGGDLDAWATEFERPADAVQSLATGIHWQGRERSEPRKKMWMFLRWLVRPHPDLRRWEHFDPADLIVPTDRHVATFALAAGIVECLPRLGPRCAHAERITAWAAQYWPTDPTRVDYGFYLWGRGRSNQRQPTPDTCYSTLKHARRRCPLGGTPMSCGARCPG